MDILDSFAMYLWWFYRLVKPITRFRKNLVHTKIICLPVVTKHSRYIHAMQVTFSLRLCSEGTCDQLSISLKNFVLYIWLFVFFSNFLWLHTGYGYDCFWMNNTLLLHWVVLLFSPWIFLFAREDSLFKWSTSILLLETFSCYVRSFDQTLVQP